MGWITYPIINLNDATDGIEEWLSNLIPHFTMASDYVSILGLKLIHVSKRGPCCPLHFLLEITGYQILTVGIYLRQLQFHEERNEPVLPRLAVNITMNKINIRRVRYHFSRARVALSESHNMLHNQLWHQNVKPVVYISPTCEMLLDWFT